MLLLLKICHCTCEAMSGITIPQYGNEANHDAVTIDMYLIMQITGTISI